MLKKFFGSTPPNKSHDVPGCSWGKNTDFTVATIEAGTLRRMCTLLRQAEALAWMCVMVLITLITLTVNYALHMKSFETVIFNDGTELVCVMQGRNDDVFARDQFGRRLKTLLKIGTKND